MKRRRFLKLLPVGILATKFAPVMDLLRVKLVRIPFRAVINIKISGDAAIDSKPTWASGGSVDLITLDGQTHKYKLGNVTYV